MHKISNWKYLIIYLILITLAEIIVAYVNPLTGVFFHIVILSILFIHSGYLSKEKMSLNELQWLYIEKYKKPSKSIQKSINELSKFLAFLISLILAPLIRILSLVMPLANFPRIQWFIIISAALYLSIFIIIQQQKLELTEYGFRWPKLKHIPIEIGIVLLAIPFGILEYLILHPAPLISSFSIENIMVAILILFIATGLMEEIIFRGILQKKTMNIMGAWQGMLFVSILFAMLHIGNLSFLDVLLVFFIGGLYALVVNKTKTIIGVTASHTIVNIMLFIVCPFIMF